MICGMVCSAPSSQNMFSQVNITNNTNWKVYNAQPATSSFWDINKRNCRPGAVAVIPVQIVLTKTIGRPVSPSRRPL